MPGDYKISLVQAFSGAGASPVYHLTDATGKEIPFDSQSAIVKGEPSAIYKLQIELNASASNVGGCCLETKQGTLSADIVVERVASSTGSTPYIFGGDYAAGYPEVGLLVLKGLDGTLSAHCTGSVIGAHQVLTAAHCISGDYTRALNDKRILFVLGGPIDDPTATWHEVVDGKVPVDSQPGGFNYRLISSDNEITTEDDVAVLYLSKDVSTSPLLLYGGTPALDQLQKIKEPLTMVGFGFYSLRAGVGEGAGKKRQAVLPITQVTARTFAYQSNAKAQSTCKGDSGGPALLEAGGGKWQIVGVTAYGSTKCTGGRSMRVDVYAPWISRYLK